MLWRIARDMFEGVPASLDSILKWAKAYLKEKREGQILSESEEEEEKETNKKNNSALLVTGCHYF